MCKIKANRFISFRLLFFISKSNVVSQWENNETDKKHDKRIMIKAQRSVVRIPLLYYDSQSAHKRFKQNENFSIV